MSDQLPTADNAVSGICGSIDVRRARLPIADEMRMQRFPRHVVPPKSASPVPTIRSIVSQ